MTADAMRARMREMCPCGPGDVAHETATAPDRHGAITVTGWCIHGRAVTTYTDSIL